MDYERGLNLLKDLAENGKNMCKLNFEGIITYEATQKNYSGSIGSKWFLV
jgi:hypothetical protein